MKFFKYSLRVLLPLVVLVVSFFIARQIISGKKKVKMHAAPSVVSVVEAEAAVKTDFRVVVKSFGTVRARTESAIVPEVSGRVVEISPNFREGGFLEQGELILSLDPRNYEIEVALKEAKLAKASQLLVEEEARAAIALRNWKRLRGGQAPTPLAVRRPQLMSARAELKAARAKLDRAELDLERTNILAPYSGRVLEKSVDMGEYVIAGNSAARIYAVDFVEVRLPLSARELEFVDISELHPGQTGKKGGKGLRQGPAVDIIAIHRGREYKWSARIVRSEGSIDEKSRQLFLVAEVADPYGKKRSSARSGGFSVPPLKVGEFVEARIQGRLLRDVYIIPRRALREGTELFIIKDGLLERRKVNVVWKDVDNVVIDNGLKQGELVVTTPAVYMKAGKFKVVPAPPAAGQSSSGSNKPMQGKTTLGIILPVVRSTPAAGQSPTKSQKPTQNKAISGKILPITKPRPAAGQSPNKATADKTLSVVKPAPDHKAGDSSNFRDWDLSELDKKPVLVPPAAGQSPTKNQKSMQNKITLGITLPITKPTPAPPAAGQSSSGSNKPMQRKTTFGITLPVGRSTPAAGQSPTKSQKPTQNKTTLGITLPVAKGATVAPRLVETSREKGGSEPSGWIIPAFDEKKQGDKEVVR